MFASTTVSTANLLYISKYKDEFSETLHFFQFFVMLKEISELLKSFSIILYLLWKKASEKQELPKDSNFFCYMNITYYLT